MKYFNSDGNEGSMCGNGGRCIVKFAQKLGLFQNSVQFNSIDGFHEAKIVNSELISLKMMDVPNYKAFGKDFIINTGSPHYIKYVSNIKNSNFVEKARQIRNKIEFLPNGINVNFIQADNENIYARTYERGVENETLSCGTGAVALALIHASINKINNSIMINAVGGKLQVSFNTLDFVSYTNIWLTGETQHIFEGQIKLI